ncbi:ChaN family lipoprotein [Fulvimarina sp. 2208YS6-2-32]|uniref:ChaN family lipoprotein n=1 Tax=Fulvimarina uroteuthidis TaxID=3098149 RepID=A0ABU5I2U5_9HYPH|nr:ChaN family lipoprotein [Fulvimarina sp. 2208YS6-2-32]MDY8109149.1 ChaN family lipoprotein [Fulvimarina sp. 2208YS6-2-32]
MKRFGVIASLGLGVVSVSSFAFADRISSLIDALPLQTAETGFSAPDTDPIIHKPFDIRGDETPIAVAMATPFGGDMPSASGALEALEAIAARNPGIGLNAPMASSEPLAVLAYDSSADALLTMAASSAPSDETGSGAPQVDAPKSVATKLFDKDDQAWRSSVYADNPLVGSIVSSDGTPSDTESLVKAVKGARYVLLGEIHDNPDHHRLQAGIIRSTAEADRKPAIVFEMIPDMFSAVLENIGETSPVDLSDLARKLSWNERGWPDFSIYEPVFQAAIENQLPLVAGNLDSDTVRDLSAKGQDAIPAAERARLGLDLPVDPAMRQALLSELGASHCGLIPDAALAPMELAQRLRDGAMASAMIEAADENGSAILIAGAGHARKDRGVPAVIEGLTDHDDAVAVQMVEIASADAKAASDYGLSREMPAPFDFTIFTPRANTTDHCADLEAMMKAKAGAAASNTPAD